MTKWGFLFVFFFGFLAYALMNVFFKETSTLEFCTSCHTMQQNFAEYKETIHYKNHAGVRATCADCHVPKEPIAKIWAKIHASKDLYHEIVGTIDTPEKFQARRWEMANIVWDKMKSSDSRECRTCHSWDAMMFSVQDKTAAKKHQRAKQEGKTCIDCHKGIAHEEPSDPNDTLLTAEAVSKPAPIAQAATTTNEITSAETDDAGEITDLVKGCNQCHGKDGHSQKEEVPNIARASAIYLHDTLMSFKDTTRQGNEYKDSEGKITDMNKLVADLSEDQITALSQYYSAKGFAPYSQTADATMAHEGSKIFDKKCEKCHSDGGTNPEDDAGIISGQPKQYLLNQFSSFESDKRDMPRKMAKKFKKLSPEQKQQIIEFLTKSISIK